ncbi:hypothetical protein GLAREA_00223 [Glarea lozoyensis ATCC 20868]|uniref:Uncharacterized protein n=1 Tax=Glarea lozoyensis (strain ATCC 20868 / MF5171) TaxID=1116229 RepID=S3CTR5_GLAL2|nr:uncharacterized protein GLAREA_00223 [Glarea lozoyensis ATCC 20868]EPE29065.1 hypothetical protein GLAREA_00223 [Glarea lozoyensis ATCC 20868]
MPKYEQPFIPSKLLGRVYSIAVTFNFGNPLYKRQSRYKIRYKVTKLAMKFLKEVYSEQLEMQVRWKYARFGNSKVKQNRWTSGIHGEDVYSETLVLESLAVIITNNLVKIHHEEYLSTLTPEQLIDGCSTLELIMNVQADSSNQECDFCLFGM